MAGFKIKTSSTAAAPPDLAVIGLTEVSQGPEGYYIFIVWSATFAPAPHGPDLAYAPVPMADFEYSV